MPKIHITNQNIRQPEYYRKAHCKRILQPYQVATEEMYLVWHRSNTTDTIFCWPCDRNYWDAKLNQ